MDELTIAALAAKSRAIARYSGFSVGAALEEDNGTIHTGCNIENASYGLTMCAERVALFKALSEGARNFRRIAIATDASKPTPPCGACRQLLWEFGGQNLEILLVNPQGVQEVLRIADLLPRAFDHDSLA
ncbi:MAG TPA: cytidine deaminase [Bryobacteraceae bacterium]|nr:cytidine deaminase [Bryobacteraceae bacterium]